MNKNVLPIVFITAAFVITAAVIAVAVLYFQPRVVSASPAQTVSQADTSQSLVDVILPTHTPAAQVQYPLVQKVKGVTMQVLGTASADGYFTVDVCYNFPDKKEDWTLGGSLTSYIALSTPDQTIFADGWNIIGDFKKDSNGKYIGRCDQLQFPVSWNTNVDKLTLTILRMSTIMPDVPDCAKAQKKLDDTKKNIKVKCFDGEFGTGIGARFSVIDKPAGMDDDTAFPIAADAFVDVAEGPWVFNLTGE